MVSKHKYVSYYIFMIFIVSIILIGGCFDTISNASKLVSVMIFYVFFPGYVTNRIAKFVYKNKTQFLLMSAAIGYAQSILIYAVVLMLGIQTYSKFIYPIYFLVCALIFFKKRCVTDISDTGLKDSVILSLFLCIAFIFGVVIYQLPNISASVVGYRNMTGDLTYWFKNCVASTKGYPLPELSIKGLNLYWHIFSCFEIAFLHMVTGIEIYTLCFTYAYIWQIFFLVGGIYICGSLLFDKYRYIYLSLAILLFSSGLDDRTYIYYQFHLYRCSLAFIEGYAMSLFAFYAFTGYMRGNAKKVGQFCVSQMLFVVTLGLKAPCACILLAAYAVRIMLEFEKDRKKVTVLALRFASYLLLFYVVSKLFIIDSNALSSSTSSHHLNLSISGTIFKSGDYKELYAVMRDLHDNKYIAFLIVIFIYFVHSNYVIAFVSISAVGTLFIYRNRKSMTDKENLSLLAASMAGMTVFIFFSHPGFSQVYFMFEAFAFIVFWSLRLLEKCGNEKTANKVMIISIALLILNVSYNIKDHELIYEVRSADYASDPHASRSGNDVSGKEIEGLRWVRDNLPQNVILVTNKVLSNGAYRTFVTSMYSERQVYLEGYGSANLPSMELVEERLQNVKDYYFGKDGGAKKLVEEGCTHSVYFKGIPETPYVEIEGDVIFENDDIMVLSLIE